MVFSTKVIRWPRFLMKSLSRRYFRQHSLRTLWRGGAVGRLIPDHRVEQLLQLSHLSQTELIQQLRSSDFGLTDEQVSILQKQIGKNELLHEKPVSWWWHLWESYYNPFSLLLTLLATVSFLTADHQGGLVITAMVILSTTLRFMQERRSNHAAEKLRGMVSNSAMVFRRATESGQESTLHEISVKELVPGDIVSLAAGDIIPADLCILSSKDLFINQSVLTGESLPVEKYSQQRNAASSNPLCQDNLCFLGTNVVSGSAKAIVIGTGNQTYFGQLAEHVTATDRTPTQFQSGINRVSWLLLRFMAVMVPIVLFLNGFTKGDWLEASLFALSVAVGLTPEMLPLIVTSTLAKGAMLLSEKQVIVKRLDSIQNFGAMNILCTDKTGTLTQGKIELGRYCDAFGQDTPDVLALAYLNSHYQTGLKNSLDVAVLEYVEQQHPELKQTAYQKIDEVPFDFNRRRMSVILRDATDQQLIVCKGAVEEMLAVCSQVQQNGHCIPLTPELLTQIHNVTVLMNQQGLRVVAIASRQVLTSQVTFGVTDEKELVLVGYVAFLDPAKETAAPTLMALKNNGINVKIMTGDNELVALKVCRDVGLTVQGVLLGEQIDQMSDEVLATTAESSNIFAKLAPLQKERLVKVLRARGHVVGFMGDGINDAPALHAADIGISVNTAVDIAKEAADIILLEKSLLVLDAGVIEGRRIFVNMLKYIKMAASSNFGNVFSVLIASAFIPFLPMLPLHLLVQNLLYDISQTAIPFDNVDEELLRKPQRWNPDEIGRFMVFFGPISSIFDVLTFLLMWFVYAANSADVQTLFQSGWFVEGLVSQTFIVHMIRTRKIPFIQSRASWSVCLMTVLIISVGIFIVMGPAADYFKLQALPLSYFGWLSAMVLGYAFLTQLMKEFYARRYAWQ